ncbi:transcriptional repressor LexA [Clostridium sp.]|uniref:transcriptional repressor LexA n=1 Tax=Clostridium sp. TaxID=1506 RepID=UPI003463EC5E
MDIKQVLSKFKEDKKHRFFIINGKEGAGKTRAALSRAIFLQDNYCIRENENILFISNEDLGDTLEEVKLDINRNNTFFTYLNNNVEICSKKQLINKCFQYITADSGFGNKRFCNKDVTKAFILEGIGELRQKEKRINKIILTKNIDFLFDEVSYIKHLNIKSLEEYQQLNRKKRGFSLRKNSKSREAIYKLYLWYCNYMDENGLLDYIDEFKLVYDNMDKLKDLKYAHILIDNVEQLTIEEVKFIRGLLKDFTYSNFILVKNSNSINTSKPWLEYFKRNKDVAIFDSNKYKVINCSKASKKTVTKKVIEQTIEEKINKELKEDKMVKNNEYIETFKYVDLKHNISHDFAIDTSSYNEVILNPDTTSEIIGDKEINKVPVYNEIAAGQPISINDEIEGEFNVPIYWLKGVQQPFILKVKGDSMINADIEDGDYIVINKQTVANHNEIVAVSIDGEATLKRLWLKGNKAVLMPENDKYYPIEIKEDNAYIIGKAVGLIKSTS